MAKVIAEKAQDAVDAPKMVEIKHTRSMKDASGNVYWPAFDLNSLGDMCPGQGYQVKMNADSM